MNRRDFFKSVGVVSGAAAVSVYAPAPVAHPAAHVRMYTVAVVGNGGRIVPLNDGQVSNFVLESYKQWPLCRHPNKPMQVGDFVILESKAE